MLVSVRQSLVLRFVWPGLAAVQYLEYLESSLGQRTTIMH